MAVLLVAGLFGPAFAQSADEAGHSQDDWRVVVVTGPVHARIAGGGWERVVEGQAFMERTELEVGDSGQLLLFNGRDTIAASPGASLILADHSAAGGVTSVRQRAGSARYDVETRGRWEPAPRVTDVSDDGSPTVEDLPVDRFEVETRYLVAIVKGTTFSITATPEQASVSVQEGVVAVRESRTGDQRDVTAGRTGMTGPANLLRVVDTASATAESAADGASEPESADADSNGDSDSDNNGNSDNDDDNDNNGNSDKDDDNDNNGNSDKDDDNDNNGNSDKDDDNDNNGNSDKDDDDDNNGNSDKDDDDDNNGNSAGRGGGGGCGSGDDCDKDSE